MKALQMPNFVISMHMCLFKTKKSYFRTISEISRQEIMFSNLYQLTCKTNYHKKKKAERNPKSPEMNRSRSLSCSNYLSYNSVW